MNLYEAWSGVSTIAIPLIGLAVLVTAMVKASWVKEK